MKRILLAGFGGQGILFVGKFLATLGLQRGMQVSWLPSYGPEMRGGTANCSVVLSENRIGSPVVATPDILVCMNRPSLDKFEEAMAPGAQLYCDSTLVDRSAVRTDIAAFEIPATRMANDAGAPALANMVMLGKMLRESALCGLDEAEQVMRKITPERKKDLLAANMAAIKQGYEG
jgi:2-oxoglutarate ferredoxin oxidoreductase subunit gamma